MARGVVLLLALVGVACVPGCGGREKELPKTVTAGEDKNDTQVVPVPDKSEPAALAVVERAIKVVTEGHPDRLGKAKVSRVTLKGTVVGPTRTQITTRRIEAVWPDRAATSDEYNDGSGPVKVLIRLRRPVIWTATIREGRTEPVPFPDPKAQAAAIGEELIGRHWMPLLVPLAEPKTVVFAARKETIKGQALDVIRAAVPGAPVFTLWFDEKTGQLGRIDFAQVEPGNTSPTQKFFVLAMHRSFGGLTLPGKIRYLQNALPVEDWDVDSWEFPDRLDDAGFDAPK